jgi:uncharacterized protein (TIGR02466 family)
MQNEVISLFPTAVMKSSLDRKLSRKEINFVKKISKNIRSNLQNSTSCDNYILENEEFVSLKEFLETQLDVYYRKVLNVDTSSKIYITQSWLNYSKPGESHHPHTHTNSFLSGVFYISTNENDRIFFRKQKEFIHIPPTVCNVWNSDLWALSAVEGYLYIFPSNLEHYVEKITGSKTRISLSFNSFISGKIGAPDFLSELKI